jgi:hypothetical protein
MSIIGISGKLQSGKNTTAYVIQYLIDKEKAGYKTKNTEEDFNSYIKNKHYLKCNYQQKAFAGKLKQIVSILTGISVADLEKQEVKDRVLGTEWNFEWYIGWENEFLPMTVGKGNRKPDEFTGGEFQYTIREFLQKLGTDAMRNVIHENVWVNALFADYRINFETKNVEEWGKDLSDNWIITDVRFPNELEAVKVKGGINIRINRPIHALSQQNNAGLLHPSETALDEAQFNYVIDNTGTIEELIEKVKQILIKEKIIT